MTPVILAERPNTVSPNARIPILTSNPSLGNRLSLYTVLISGGQQAAMLFLDPSNTPSSTTPLTPAPKPPSGPSKSA